MLAKNIFDVKKVYFGAQIFKVVIYDQEGNPIDNNMKPSTIQQYVDKGGYPAVEILCVQGFMPTPSRDGLLLSGFLANTEGDQLPGKAPVENVHVPIAQQSDNYKQNAWTTDYEIAVDLQKDLLVQFNAELTRREESVRKYRELLDSILTAIE